MNENNKPVDAFLQEEKQRGEGNSYRNAETIHPGDVFHPKTNQKDEKFESRWVDQGTILLYGIIGLVIVAIVLLFVFL